MINSKTDVVDLVQKMSLINIIKKAIFKKHYQILLPLALVQMKKSQNRKKIKSERFFVIERGSRVEITKNLDLDGSIQDHEDLDFDSRLSLRKKTKRDFLFYDKTYRQLVRLYPKNSIEKMCNDRIVSYLSFIFEEEKNKRKAEI